MKTLFCSLFIFFHYIVISPAAPLYIYVMPLSENPPDDIAFFFSPNIYVFSFSSCNDKSAYLSLYIIYPLICFLVRDSRDHTSLYNCARRRSDMTIGRASYMSSSAMYERHVIRLSHCTALGSWLNCFRYVYIVVAPTMVLRLASQTDGSGR